MAEKLAEHRSTAKLHSLMYLTAQAQNESDVYIAWTPEDHAEGYYIYRSLEEEGEYERIGFSLTTEYVDSGLQKETLYYYKVAAYGKAVVSDAAGPVGVTTIFHTLLWPQYLFAEALGAYDIRITWASVGDADGYYIYRGLSKAGAFELIGIAETIDYTDSSLSPDTTYYYKVAAFDDYTVSIGTEPVCAATMRSSFQLLF